MKLKSTLACITAIACIMKITPLVAQANKQDSLALVDLYNSTMGTTWYHNNNWLTAAPLNDWFGVVVSPENGKVTKIELHVNSLKGTLPASIGDLTELKSLVLGGNDLSGPIPESIGNLTALQELWLYMDGLTGGIPTSIGKLTKLTLIDLDHNQLSDTLPSSMGKLSKLVTLNLYENHITGSIPASFGNLDSLQTLSLHHNSLTGKIPAFLGNLSRLQNLTLEFNQLEGPVPASLASLPSIQAFGITHNKFTFNGMEELAKANYKILGYYSQAPIPIKQDGNQLLVSAGGTLENNTYQWYKDSKLIATETGKKTKMANKPGKYNVVVTNSIATQLTLYSDTVIIGNLTTAGNTNADDASEEQTTTAISISPNPVKNNATVVFTATGQYKMQATSLSGRTMYTKEGVAANGRNTIQLDVSRYAPGTYIILLTDEKKQSRSIKFNKE